MTKRKITKLTAEQSEMLTMVCDEWLAHGLSTEPADFEKAKAALAGIYREGGLAAPRFVICVSSPRAGVIAQALMRNRGSVDAQVHDQVDARVHAQVRGQVDAQVHDQVHAQVRGQVDARVDAQVHDQVRAQVRGQVDARVDARVRDQVRDQVHAQVHDQVRAQVRDQVRDQVHDQVDAQVHDQVDARVHAQVRADLLQDWYAGYNGGNLWAGWCGYYDAMGRLGVTVCQRFEPTRELSRNCGWWWSFRHFAVLTDRPELICRDEAGRLHSETGPAMRYRDGWSIYAWHGTRIPAEWIEKRAELDPQIGLTWPNIEQRRSAAEIIGWDKTLASLSVRSIDRDRDPKIGELIEVDVPDAPGSRFLRVRCPTQRDFVLPVPRELTRAIDANMWTYPALTELGVTADEYRSAPRT